MSFRPPPRCSRSARASRCARQRGARAAKRRSQSRRRRPFFYRARLTTFARPQIGSCRNMSEIIIDALGRDQPLAVLSGEEGASAHTAVVRVSMGTTSWRLRGPSARLDCSAPAPAAAATCAGPTFAVELMDGKPTAIVAASKDEELAHKVQRLFASSNLRRARGKRERRAERDAAGFDGVVGGSLVSCLSACACSAPPPPQSEHEHGRHRGGDGRGAEERGGDRRGDGGGAAAREQRDGGAGGAGVQRGPVARGEDGGGADHPARAVGGRGHHAHVLREPQPQPHGGGAPRGRGVARRHPQVVDAGGGGGGDGGGGRAPREEAQGIASGAPACAPRLVASFPSSPGPSPRLSEAQALLGAPG